MPTFQLFQIPVTIRPSFLVVALVLGIMGTTDPVFVAAWMGVVFVSILIHELGHAFTARSFGASVEIELNGVGGLTRWSIDSARIGPGRRAVVAASGSAVGVMFGGAVWLIASGFGPYAGLSLFVIQRLVFVNVFWGLLNWLPIRPLDGGHLLMSALEKFAPHRKEPVARVVFGATAALGLVLGIAEGLVVIAIIAAFLLYSELFTVRPDLPAGPIPELSYDDEPDAPEPGEEAAPTESDEPGMDH